MTSARPAWSPEKDAELRALYAEGLTHAQIASKLGITKNASVGRAGRLGLERRQKGTPRAKPPLTLVARTDTGCRWPMWGYEERPTQVFCGAAPLDRGPDEPLSSYCPEHSAKAYIGKSVRPGVGAAREADGRSFR